MELIIVLQVLFILFIHGVADFLLQTRDMAMNKSISNYWLSMHVFYYTLGITPIGLLVWYHVGVYGWTLMIYWVLINGGLHWITDYYTSRWTKKLREQEKFYGFPSFFTVIELDQLIHYTTLFITFWLFTS